MDDIIMLVVPATFSVPSASLSRKSLCVKFWDPVDCQLRTRCFPDHDEGRKFLADKKEALKTMSLRRCVKVSDILTKHDYFTKHYRIQQVSEDYPEQDVPLDPKILGLWLGDGVSCRPEIASVDEEIQEYIMKFAASRDLVVVKRPPISYYIAVPEGTRSICRVNEEDIKNAVIDRNNGATLFVIKEKYGFDPETIRKYIKMDADGTIDEYIGHFRENTFFNDLKAIGVFRNKHIPDLYKHNTRDIRLQVLGGLIDTDGTLAHNGYVFGLADKRLTEDLAELARSLGFTVTPHVIKRVETVQTLHEKYGEKTYISYPIRISGGKDLMEIPILLPPKTPKPQNPDLP